MNSILLELDYSFFGSFKSQHPDFLHEDIQQRNNLLVTIGDSWTWGDSLGITNKAKGIVDPDRLNLVYGKHLQNHIGSHDWDWINIAMPGTANLWIADSATRFIDIRKKISYQKIILSIGLTDITRDTIQQFDQSANGNPNGSLVDIMHQFENDIFKKIKKIETQSDMTVIVGRNFTNTMSDQRIGSINHHLKDRWVDISADHCKMPRPPKCLGYHILDVLAEKDKIWALEHMIPNSLVMTDFLMACPLHYKKASKHPTEQSHELWAKYIWEYLEKNQLIT
jgi:hypothetical protein